MESSRGTPQMVLTPRSPKVLLHCVKPTHEKASVVPLLEVPRHKINLPEKKKKKYQQLLSKENEKAKLSKQNEILAQQMKTRLARENISTKTKHAKNESRGKPAPVSLHEPNADKSVVALGESSETSHPQTEPASPQTTRTPDDVNIVPLNQETRATSPRISSAIPQGTEWKALTIYQTLQEHDRVNQVNQTRHKNSLLLSQEYSQQISLKKEQYQREREADIEYFSTVVLKDVQQYRRECKEKEENKRKTNESHGILLKNQKRSDARIRNHDQREEELIQVRREREIYEQEEKRKREKKRLLQMKYRNELLQQMKEQQHLSENENLMTSTERSINRTELATLKDDPTKYDKVKNMLTSSVFTGPPPSTTTPSSITSSPVKRGRRLKGWEGAV